MKERKVKMNRRFSITLLFLLFFGVSVFAQQKTITGTITESDGEPVIGASILVKGTSVGTVTDIDGHYSIAVPATGKTLVISYVGLRTKEEPISGSVMNITLHADATSLDEVVAIGYATVKKRDVVGTVSSVGGKALEDIPVASPAQALSGKMAGVQVTTSEGSPDAEIKIRVRGGTSINRSSDPLYIVDGFPVNSINDIAPGDIQSIDVLKDASSTAIYGSRGANGVIIVTTKSGKEGKLTINYNGYYGFKKIAKKLDVLNSYEYALWNFEHAAIQGRTNDSGFIEKFGTFDNIDQYKDMGSIDWQDEVYGRTGTTFNNSLSISGGSKTANFNLSYNRIDDKAIMIGSDYVRNNLNFKINAEPHPKVKLSFSTRYSDTKVEGAGANDVTGGEKSTSDSRLKQSIQYTPIGQEISDEEENSYDPESQLVNPIQAQSDNYREQSRMNFNINGGISFLPIKNLTLRTELGYDINQRDDSKYYGLSTYFVRENATIKKQPAILLTDNYVKTFRNTNTVSMNFSDYFSSKNHTLDALVGQETVVKISGTNTSDIQGFPTYYDAQTAFHFTTQGTPISINEYYNPDNKLVSFFGRANYEFMGKYLLTGTLRADGSSLFARGNQWGVFPSAAAAWRISEESFMQSTSNWLSNLKLRISYGVAGNNDVPYASYLKTYKSSSTSYINNISSIWAAESKLENPNLEWETTTTRNIGLDYGFFNNRLNGSVEFYWNNVKNLLIDFPIDPSTGYASQMQNLGKTSNKGVEFTVNYVILEHKDYGLDFNFNIGVNKNKVDDLGGLDEITAASGWTSEVNPDYKVKVGKPLGQMYGYVTDGYYGLDDFEWSGGKWVLTGVGADGKAKSDATNPNGPGSLKLRDLDGDGHITTADQELIGDVNPDFSGGFGVNARYKWFDLSANFTYSVGNDVYNANKVEFTSTSKFRYRNMLTDVSSGNRWTNMDESGNLIAPGTVYADEAAAKAKLAEMNQNASIWNPFTRQYNFHSWAVEDGSFLRLTNLTVGFSVPKNLIAKIGLQQLRFYFSGYNLFCITDYSGYDPEVDARRKTPLTPNVDSSAYPKSRSYNFGLNVTF